MARKSEAITAIPLASPSMLSSMFTALVMPTSQKMVSAMFAAGSGVHGSSKPKLMTRIAAAICTTSF